MSELEEIEETKERGPVKYRSVSQVKQYQNCPYQYRLQRRERAWQRPAAWFPQGTAVHEAIERFEKSGRTMTLAEMQEAFREAYSRDVARLTEVTPNFRFWYWSGPYDGERDLERRWHIGLEQVAKYYDYAMYRPDWKPSEYGDEIAVELEFKVKFGGVEVRGFIDNVTDDEPVDVKTGNQPGDDFQLGTYAGALEQMYDVRPSKGYYWMGRTGKLTVPYDLTEWTQQRLADVFGEVDEKIKAEEFPPLPDEKKCRFCPVSNACEFSLA